MNSLRMTEDRGAGAAFNTRNVDDSLPAVNPTSLSENTAEAALNRLRDTLGLPEPDAGAEARWSRKHESAKGVLCCECGNEYSDSETIYYSRVRHQGFFAYCYQKVSYCDSCKPSLWNTEYGDCDVCNRTVHYPYKNIDRRHVFCSEKCKRDHYNNIQREKRLKSRQKQCNGCSKEFTAPRSDTKFCSAACKQKAYRARQEEAA